MTTLKQIVVVGSDLQERFPDLLRSLHTHGFQVGQVGGTADLDDRLRENSQAIVLTYEPRGKRAAEAALRAVARTGRKTPVVALVEQGSCEDYCELMSEGTYDYFEVPRELSAIERSLEWATRMRAA